MTERITFFVPGTPVTQGNHRFSAKHRKAYETTDGHSAWRAIVTMLARSAWRGRPTLDCAVSLELEFFVEPPKSAKYSDLPHKSGGDNSKLQRAVEDSLEAAGVYTNDRRITDSLTKRRYAFGEQPVGCRITVGPARW